MPGQRRGDPQLLPCKYRERNLPISMPAQVKTGLQFRLGAEPSLTMVRREHGFIFSEWASGWELACWMMSLILLNALGMPRYILRRDKGGSTGTP